VIEFRCVLKKQKSGCTPILLFGVAKE